MFCTRCGGNVVPGSGFCAKCGNPVSSSALGSGRSPSGPLDDSMMARPLVITLLAIADFLFGALWLFAAVAIGLSLADGPQTTAAIVFLLIAVVLGLLAFAAGVGLFQMREFGRKVQIGLAVVGLLGVPVGTIISALILYYLTRPGIRVLFSGKSAARLTSAEAAAVLQLRSSGGAGVAIALAVGAIALVGFTGIMAAIAIPNLLTAMQRSKQKRTMADVRSIATAWEAFATDHNTFAPSRDMASQFPEYMVDGERLALPASSVVDYETLAASLSPTYIRQVPRLDGWSHDIQFLVGSEGQEYAIRSLGKDGIPDADSYEVSATRVFDCDIVYSMGSFVSYPGGTPTN